MSPEPNPLDSPETFLNALPHLYPGWSEQYGGALEVARKTAQFQEQLNQQAQTIAAIRAAAIHELLKTQRGVDIAKQLGLTRAAISRLSKAEKIQGMPW
ncbi:hypothetical protein ACIP5Z_11560 [Rothia terrae]|uniref:hypothetical protein n=1 Tax=Rothia terrae TaxID=396015 RepID=UPI003830F09A